MVDDLDFQVFLNLNSRNKVFRPLSRPGALKENYPNVALGLRGFGKKQEFLRASK